MPLPGLDLFVSHIQEHLPTAVHAYTILTKEMTRHKIYIRTTTCPTTRARRPSPHPSSHDAVTKYGSEPLTPTQPPALKTDESQPPTPFSLPLPPKSSPLPITTPNSLPSNYTSTPLPHSSTTPPYPPLITRFYVGCSFFFQIKVSKFLDGLVLC